MDYLASSLLMDIGLFPVLVLVVLQWIALYICLFVFLPAYLWNRFLEVGLLDQKVNTYIILLDIAKFSFTRVVSLYFTCLTRASSYRYCCQTWELFPVWYFSVVLIFISLKMSKFAYLSICIRIFLFLFDKLSFPVFCSFFYQIINLVLSFLVVFNIGESLVP